MVEPTVRRGLLLTAVLIGCGGGSLFAQSKSKCTDQPLRFFVYDWATLPDGVTTVRSAIRGDGNWYTNGTNLSAVIHSCSGTYDAVLNLLVNKDRKLTFVFSEPVPNSFVDESIPAGTYQRNGLVNIANLLCIGCSVNAHQPFTSHAFAQATSLVNGHDFALAFSPYTVDSPDMQSNSTKLLEDNTPNLTSPVQVIPQPYDCLEGGAAKPAWIVRGTMQNNDPVTPAGYGLQVGTAHSLLIRSKVRAGQYSMPFEIRIESLQCFAY